MQSAVGIENFTACQTDVRTLLHKFPHHPKRIFLDDSVRIQEQDVLPARLFQTDIIRCCKSKITGIGEELHGGKLLANHFHAPVIGSVVDNDDLRLHPLRRLTDGEDGIFKECPDVVIDYDNRELQLVPQSLPMTWRILSFQTRNTAS